MPHTGMPGLDGDILGCCESARVGCGLDNILVIDQFGVANYLLFVIDFGEFSRLSKEAFHSLLC